MPAFQWRDCTPPNTLPAECHGAEGCAPHCVHPGSSMGWFCCMPMATFTPGVEPGAAAGSVSLVGKGRWPREELVATGGANRPLAPLCCAAECRMQRTRG